MLCPQAGGQRHLFQLCFQNEMNISHGTVWDLFCSRHVDLCTSFPCLCPGVELSESCGCLGGVLGKGCLWLAQICS